MHLFLSVVLLHNLRAFHVFNICVTVASAFALRGYGRQAVGIVLSPQSYVTVAQLVEHGTHKPRVAGSIPARDTILYKIELLCYS